MTTTDQPTPTPETEAAYLATLQWCARHNDDTQEQRLDALINDPRPESGWQVARALERECAELRKALRICAYEAEQIEQTRWGYDGDCGAVNCANRISDACDRALTPQPQPEKK